MTSRLPSELTPPQWLATRRATRSIEGGLRQRLDVSHREDACRVRRPKAMPRTGMSRRWSHNLFLVWRRP